MSNSAIILISERDSTVRNRSQHNQQKQPDSSCNKKGLQSHNHKLELSAGMLRESSVVILLLGFMCLVRILVLISVQQLSSTGHFNALRARKHLERITSVGPRTIGSPENEITTVNYLLDQIKQIRSESETGPHSITVDVQRPTGSFSINGFISYYDRVTNIAVKLQPKTRAQHFMLANCHFDSVANSPGASDDAVSCSVMLEVLHSLANLSTPLKHGVIFLFNGAEENNLQASHGFITQHPWAQQVRAFVNLEAAGVGGKELVFQTGPENPWLVQAYARAAVHPFASVVGQEIFQSGLIPSDTDFRIYRDFGNIPGIDLAFIENGYIYHTKYDTPERIPTDSIQRAGVLYKCDLVYAVCVVIFSWFVTLVTVLIVALIVTLTGRSMFWYTHFYAAVCLYGSAATGTIVLIHTLTKDIFYRSTSRVYLAELFFDVSLLLWCFLLLILTMCGFCSAYVPMMMVVFPLISKLLLRKHFRARGASLQYSVLYLTGLAVPYVHIMFLIWVVFEVFTPIQGRSGTGIPPDVVLALIVTLATVILSTYFLHVIYLSRSMKHILAGLGSVFTVMFVLVCCGLFFPYSADPSSPRPKRIFVQHTTRRFHALNGSLQSSDSGLCISSVDYTDMQHITPHIPQINDSIRWDCQDRLPYCGSSRKSWYLPAPEVSPEAPLEFRLLSRQETEWGTVKMTFEVKGPSLMSLRMRPQAGASLSSWSFGDRTPQFNRSGGYVISYSRGLDAPAWSFWFEIQPPKSSDASPDEGLISLAVSAHYFSGSDRHSEQLESLLKRFPAWVFPSSWISTYHMYRY
ncbi:endoplasmic reticulum metallopeptidase 1-like isoform X3 [Megalobrama amblycephala]|uniref:endoplasmic reticulum metallopeptidase 1-like isoform X3 n=1 Tax=Megalobrama amblycephala TaxID=75352 RepID=UPI0020145D1E|nr:endoplasmic reticulum metallopeptidase 1-like isoform X3 [Megalobrama amblycephala]